MTHLFCSCELVQRYMLPISFICQPASLCQLLACSLYQWFFYFVMFLHQFSSVQSLSHVRLFVTPWTAARQASVSITNCQSLLKLCPLSQWCHPTISSSVIPFSSHLQSFPASESFQVSQLFLSGGQSIGVSGSASVLPMNIQDWLPLGWTGWISLQSKGLSRIFSNTTVQKLQFFGALRVQYISP